MQVALSLWLGPMSYSTDKKASLIAKYTLIILPLHHVEMLCWYAGII
jgi:hypothetical protein